jgi:Ca2+-binding EF-hand superfamily protein
MFLFKTGQIEFDEFCRVMADSFFKKHSQDELRAAFRQFDQDNSGYIQAAELENIMRKMGRRFNKSEIDAMVRSLDSSGDGQISFDEFVQLFK